MGRVTPSVNPAVARNGNYPKLSQRQIKEYRTNRLCAKLKTTLGTSPTSGFITTGIRKRVACSREKSQWKRKR